MLLDTVLEAIINVLFVVIIKFDVFVIVCLLNLILYCMLHLIAIKLQVLDKVYFFPVGENKDFCT